MIQNQISNATKYDRYPDIFEQLASNNSIAILSFGCSKGEECRTLSEKYFPNAEITGVDIDSKIISDNIANNENNKINYFDILPTNKSFDIIFCMSVLCVWPEVHPQYEYYTFDKFEKTIIEIDKVLSPGGYLVIYNSSFCFTETSIFKNYKIINLLKVQRQFVIKKSKLGETIVKHKYVFQKNQSL